MAENEEYYEPDIISVTDDDGNELLFELLERYETDNDVYVAITKLMRLTRTLLTATMR